MATISTTPRRAMPKTDELEDSLGDDGDGTTGELEEIISGESNGNNTNNINKINDVEKHYLSDVETIMAASFRAWDYMVWCQPFRELVAHSAPIGASTTLVARTRKTLLLVVANRPCDTPEKLGPTKESCGVF